jgi:hypothetical protein
MLMLMQADAPPPLPWWVMYVALLGLAYGTWRLTRLRWWGGCLTAGTGWALLFIVGLMTIPGSHVGLILSLPFVPLLAWVVAMLRGHGGGVTETSLGGRIPAPVMRQIAPGAMQGQPSARAVLRARVMEARYAAGLPRNAAFVARLRYVSGLGEMSARPADLFVGDARLWVAPLSGEPAAIPVPARDVLRVDVWPELEGPPTLRVNFSPPGAAEGTRDLVLATMPNVPPALVEPQLQAIAGVLQGLIRAETEAARIAADTPVTDEAQAEAPARACPRCGETVPPGAAACPRCALPL